MSFALAALLLLQAGPGSPKPAIHHVRITRDTAWFEGNRGFDTTATRYCFVRRTGDWCRLPGPPALAAPTPSVPQSTADTIPVAPGLALLCRPHGGSGRFCDTFGVRSADDGSVHWLTPRLTPSWRDALARAIPLETDQPLSISTAVTAHAANARSVWFGLGGGFPEGEGAFGGLLRFDRASRVVETIVHPKLAGATVTALAADERWLWVGTAHPGEFGYWGSTGILRRDLRTGRWSALDSRTTPIPDNLVQTLAASEDALYVATSDGLAVLNTRTGRWTVRYFQRESTGDSIVHALALTRPPDEAAAEARFKRPP